LNRDNFLSRFKNRDKNLSIIIYRGIRTAINNYRGSNTAINFYRGQIPFLKIKMLKGYRYLKACLNPILA
jgi:hypothetical protein